MEVLFLIIMNVILPVFALIIAGAVLHRTFKFDINTLSKLLNYFLMPSMVFVYIYESRISGSVLIELSGFLLLQSTSLILLCYVIAKVAKLDERFAVSFKNSVVLNNSGNFGLPVSQLVFHNNPLGLSIQIVVTIFQNLLTYTYGMLNSVSTNHKGSKAVLEFLKLPILYALVLGILLNAFHIQLPYFIWNPITNLSNAFLAVALITLGAQAAYLKIHKVSLPLILSVIGRLVLSPAVALLWIFCLGLEGTTAQALFIASSYPSSRNSALLALEFGNEPEYAAQAVLVSTLLSSITVALAVYLAGVLF